MDAPRRSRIEAAALAAIVVMGVGIRLAFLSRPMQLDESYSYNEYAAKPVLDGLSWYTLPNNHLLNTLLVHLSTEAFGKARWAVRLPAFLAGVALIPATFAMVAGLRGRMVALTAAALVAASEPLIDYSTNSRGYTIVALCTALLVATARRIMADGGRARDWAWFTLLPVLGGFAIPIMLYPYGGVALWLTIASRWPGNDRRGRVPVRLDRLIVSGLFAGLLTVALYLPAILRTGVKSVAGNQYVSPRPWAEVLVGLPESLGLAWLQWSSDMPIALAALLLLAGAASGGRVLIGRGDRLAPGGVILAVLAWTFAVAAAQRVIPYDRVWHFAIPLYAACVADGLSMAAARLPAAARPRGPWPGPMLAVGLCAALTAFVATGETLGPKYWLTPLHADEMVRRLKPALGPDDAVVARAPADSPFKYEFLRHEVPVEYLYDYRIARARRLFVLVLSDHQTFDEVLDMFQVPASRYTPPRIWLAEPDAILYVMERRDPAAGDDAPGTATR
jgi:hypothetical protein